MLARLSPRGEAVVAVVEEGQVVGLVMTGDAFIGRTSLSSDFVACFGETDTWMF